MIFQDKILEEGVSEFICLIIYIAMLVIYLCLIVMFIKRYRESHNVKITLPVTFMFICLFVSRSVFMVFDFYLTEFDTNNYGDYVLIWKIGLLTLFSGMGVLLYIIDGLLFKGKDKYFFTIAYIVTMIIILITPDIETAQSISMMAMVFVMIVPLGYGYIAAKSTGEVRKKSIYVIVGVIMWAVCSALTAKDLVDVFTTVLPVYLYDIHSIMNIAKTIGIIFMAKGYL